MRARGLTVHFDADADADADAGAGADAGDGGPDLPVVPAPVVTAISAAAREALANVAEHARTGEAWVTVRRTGGVVTVTVRDAGKGFDPAGVGQLRLGLRRSITERTVECGGQATVRSAPGRGTEVSLCWPATSGQAAGPGQVPAGPGQVPAGSIPVSAESGHVTAGHASVPADSSW
jgi:signal transduction histidine kinase